MRVATCVARYGAAGRRQRYRHQETMGQASTPPFLITLNRPSSVHRPPSGTFSHQGFSRPQSHVGARRGRSPAIRACSCRDNFDNRPVIASLDRSNLVICGSRRFRNQSFEPAERFRLVCRDLSHAAFLRLFGHDHTAGSMTLRRHRTWDPEIAGVTGPIRALDCNLTRRRGCPVTAIVAAPGRGYRKPPGFTYLSPVRGDHDLC